MISTVIDVISVYHFAGDSATPAVLPRAMMLHASAAISFSLLFHDTPSITIAIFR